MERKGFFCRFRVFATLCFTSATLCYAQNDLACFTGVVYYQCGSSKPYPTVEASSEKCGAATNTNVTRGCYWSVRSDPRTNFKDCIIKRGGCSLTPSCGKEDDEVLSHQELKGLHCCFTANCNTKLNEEPTEHKQEKEQSTLVAWILLITFGSLLGVGFVATFVTCLIVCVSRLRREQLSSTPSVNIRVAPSAQVEAAEVTAFQEDNTIIPMASRTNHPENEIVPVASVVMTDAPKSTPNTSLLKHASMKENTVVQV